MLLLFSAATFNILSHRFRFVNSFFHFLFESFQIRFAVFSSVLYLTRCSRVCQQLFIFSFLPLRCFSRVSYTIPFNRWFVNRFFQFFVLFFNKRGSRMKSIHPVPSSAAFSYKKPFNMRRNSQLNKLF